ncbi:MAG: GGDEF domain-containing protein, partial [Desulfatitalea sp.]|nr:GGDEF domain-containing protein [Desulfatitalea sp.]
MPITPQNFAVWYSYAAGENSELQKSLDTMIAHGGPFNNEVNETLYLKFGFGREAQEIKKLREALLQVLLSILHEISAIAGETAHYESFLSDSVGLLTKDVAVEDIKGIVEQIIAETKAIVAFGKAAQQKIDTITGELTVLRENFEHARSEALMDFLTGIANRKAFDETFDQMVAEAEGCPQGLCLLIIDIDHFKNFNDIHGHVVGDEVLRFTAQKLKSQVRGSDFVARIGGEEFAILLPATALEGARAVAENIRSFFSTVNLKKAGTDKKLGRVTVSIGVA